MVQLTRIYTRGGDKGKTSLGDGKRILKSHARIEAIGTVDEANAFIGITLCHFKGTFQEDLMHVQHDLFDLGADLCVERQTDKLSLQPQQIRWLERKIDQLNASLPPLKSFVLPGGTEGAACCHFARTLVRTAERRVVHLAQEENVSATIIGYLNRLSDYLFVLARAANRTADTTYEILWEPGKYQGKEKE